MNNPKKGWLLLIMLLHLGYALGIRLTDGAIKSYRRKQSVM